MKKKKNVASKPRAAAKHHNNTPRRQNPHKKQQHRGNRGGRRRNPNIGKNVGGFFRQGIVAILAALATRQLPQIVLAGKNTGIVGYLANTITAMGISAATTKVLGRQDGIAAGIGGAVYTVSRMASENLSPSINALSMAGLGDPAAHVGRGLGTIKDTYMPVPPVWDENGRPYIPREILAAVAERTAAPMPGSSMAGIRMARG